MLKSCRWRHIQRYNNRWRFNVLIATLVLFYSYIAINVNYIHTANTPHNPVRFANTIGVVIERVRPSNSIDRLRWYCRDQSHASNKDPVGGVIIREEAFHVTDLGTQLKPLINNWMSNESIRKCKECGNVAEPKWKVYISLKF